MGDTTKNRMTAEAAASKKVKETQAKGAPGDEKKAQAKNAPSDEKKAQAKNAPNGEKKAQVKNALSDEKKAQAKNAPSNGNETQTKGAPGDEKKAQAKNTPAIKEAQIKNAAHNTAAEAKTGSPAAKDKQSGQEKADADENLSDEERFAKRDAERARKREARRRKVRLEKIALAVLGVAILGGVIAGAAFGKPSAKLARRLSKGDTHLENAEYENAREAYEAALLIDEACVEAYHGLAESFLAQEKVSEAEEILYQGWEATKQESLLKYYCTLILNEATAEINAKNVTLSTLDKCVRVLELDGENADALSRLDTCHERLFLETEEGAYCDFFYDEDLEKDTCRYAEYETLIRRMLEVYLKNPSKELGDMLTRYALIDSEPVRISKTHLADYMALLSDISEARVNDDIMEAVACLNAAKEVEDYFAQAFEEFEAGNYEYARKIVADKKYQQIRDSFIEGDSGYWEGDQYVPVNREQLVLVKLEGHYYFYFLDYEDCENLQGVITVWGTKQEDDGVQRSAVSYEPARENGQEFPRTEYIVQYLYSNVKIDGEYVPQMNYRFDKKVTTKEGTTTSAVGDWGGEHEFEIDY